jgi:3'-phosphoadenosine 5'-phosphosulfate sulfotransferase (PAPS reductase)/FAD synthetase
MIGKKFPIHSPHGGLWKLPKRKARASCSPDCSCGKPAARSNKLDRLLPLKKYDWILISLSGGKDSFACTLFIRELARKEGIDPRKIVLCHQDVDGGIPFFDWPITIPYTKKLAEYLDIQCEVQWRQGGIYKELMRKGEPTEDVYYTWDHETIMCDPSRRRLTLGTRLMWPAKVPASVTRWCTGYIKIDVFSRFITDKFPEGNLLVITGERREESAKRSKYNEIELHRSNSKRRIVHHWRPVIDWEESQIWEILNRHQVQFHPAYHFFPRVSCGPCIFLTKHLWATLNDLWPEKIAELAKIEKDLNHTIDRDFSLMDFVSQGVSRVADDTRHFRDLLLSENFDLPMHLPSSRWKTPNGAYGIGGGPL